MSENNSDNGFKADIPQDAIEEALRSVESHQSAGAEEGENEEVRKLRALLNESTERAAQTAERLKETHERYLRLAADFDNWKKRTSRDRDEAVKFANEKILKDLLLVIDNLERAVASGGDAAALQNGLRLVLKQFSDTLGRHGVTSFSAVGQPFDPSKHEAVASDPGSSGSTVVEVYQNGYMLGSTLLRPAMVKVGDGPVA